MNVPLPGMAEAANRPAVVTYDNYLDAQRAVDFLSDNSFPVQHTAIIGTDLRMVESVTGRLTYARVAASGAVAGAWFGVFIGLLLWGFGGASAWVVAVAAGYGAAFGVIFQVISYAMTGGRRDFSSRSQIVATSYTVVVAPEHAARARQLLSELPLKGNPRPL